MPFDGTVNTPALNRARLVEALRQPMPEGFEFDYSIALAKHKCGTLGCAMGLACVMGIVAIATQGEIAAALAISHGECKRIFYSPETYGFEEDEPEEWKKITPQMVADALERV